MCACERSHNCAVRGDLIRILARLLKRKTKFDAVLVETTGLADPAPVVQTFFVDEVRGRGGSVHGHGRLEVCTLPSSADPQPHSAGAPYLLHSLEPRMHACRRTQSTSGSCGACAWRVYSIHAVHMLSVHVVLEHSVWVHGESMVCVRARVCMCVRGRV